MSLTHVGRAEIDDATKQRIDDLLRSLQAADAIEDGTQRRKAITLVFTTLALILGGLRAENDGDAKIASRLLTTEIEARRLRLSFRTIVEVGNLASTNISGVVATIFGSND